MTFRNITVLGIVVGFLVFPATARANISVEPTLIEKVMEPSSTDEGSYWVTNNNSSEPLKITVQLEDWMGYMQGAYDKVKVDEWLKIEPNSFTLQPGEKKQIKYRIITPPDFKNEKVAQVFFRFTQLENFEARLGVVFYLSAKGQDKLSAEITQLSAKYRDVNDPRDELLLSMEIKNNSNFHIRPTGTIEVKNLATNQVVYTYAVDRIPSIYPNQPFAFDYLFHPESIPPGDYEVRLKLNYGNLYGKDVLMEKTAAVVWERKEKAST